MRVCGLETRPFKIFCENWPWDQICIIFSPNHGDFHKMHIWFHGQLVQKKSWTYSSFGHLYRYLLELLRKYKLVPRDGQDLMWKMIICTIKPHIPTVVCALYYCFYFQTGPTKPSQTRKSLGWYIKAVFSIAMLHYQH